MAARKAAKKRRGPKHPGVVLVKPDPAKRMGWRARYKDPDKRKYVRETLDASYTTVEQREAWAVSKSRELAKRRQELDGGAARETGTSLSDAVKKYFDDHPRLSDRSKADYRDAVDHLIEWATSDGLESADELTRAKLLGYRSSAIKRPKRATYSGSKRGARKLTEELRAPESVNGELRKVGTVLGYLRAIDLLPRLSRDDLTDGLKKLAVSTERIEFLKATECKKLLEAAIRHDADTHKITRAEHDGVRPVGTTPKYEPIAPFVAFVLLSGMRLGEAIAVEWKQVDLDALDNSGHQAGEIHLSGSEVKTGRARTVGLEVSAALHSMLSAMKLASGGKGTVFNHTEGTAEAASKRLRAEYGAPEAFGWQMLRRTCGTFLTNAPGIFESASAYRSAKQLGHGVAVAERHYLGLVRGIPRDARTLEAAMQIESELERVIARVGKGARGKVASVVEIAR